MTRRSREWNEGLAGDLKDPVFAREFLMAAMEEGVPVQVVLGKIIRAYGIKEFSRKTRIANSNLVRVTRPNYNPTQETLNRLLKPFGLKLTVGPIEEKARKKPA